MIPNSSLIVSSVEPTGTNRKKVWMQKGKNLFDGKFENKTISSNGTISDSTTRIKTINPIKVESNSYYTVLSSNVYCLVFEYDADKSFIQRIGTDWNKSFPYTFQTTENTKYISLVFCYSDNSEIGINDITDLEIELGTEIVEKKIYVKNDNGVYKEFISKDDSLVVSSTEPDKRRKIWLQKGKNLLNINVRQTKNGVTIKSNSDGSITLNGTATADTRIDIPIDLNLRAGTYTHSRNNVTLNNTYLSLDNINDTMLNKSLTERSFTINQNTNYTYYVIWFGSGVVFNNVTLYLQVEQGLKATEFEKYINPTIYVKNDNGVYEEFISKDDSMQIYSTEEVRIGTWIDGKPLYRKVVSGTIDASTTSGQFVYTDILIASNIDSWIKADATIYFTSLNRKTSLPYTLANGNRLYLNQITSYGIEFANETAYGGTVTVICEYTKTTD